MAAADIGQVGDSLSWYAGHMSYSDPISRHPAADESSSAPTFQGPSHDYGGRSQQVDDPGLTFTNTMQAAAAGRATRSEAAFLPAEAAADRDPVPRFTALPGPDEKRIGEAEPGGGGAPVPPLTTVQHPQARILHKAANRTPEPRNTATTAARVAMSRANEPMPRTAQPRNDLAMAAARAVMRPG